MTDSPPPDTSPPSHRHPEDFEHTYATAIPAWDIGRPQPAFEGLARSGALTGKVLDIGCGTGEHALLASSLGFEAVGVDIAPTAIDKARTKAMERNLGVRFLVWNALKLPELGEQFDTVLDCGLFHVLDDHDRATFVQSLAAVVRPGGHYHMLCFSELQPGAWGPRRVTQDEIRRSFVDGWLIEIIERAAIETTFAPEGAVAWLSAITRA